MRVEGLLLFRCSGGEWEGLDGGEGDRDRVSPRRVTPSPAEQPGH